MDEELLRGKGLEPEGGEIAAFDGFALRIGQRAALVPTPGAKVYGLVFSLMRSERLNWIASILNRASRLTSHRPCSRIWPAEASSPPFATTFHSRRRLPNAIQDGPKNIWFEPHAGTFGSFAKDKVELLLWRKVCVKNTMTLDQAKTDYLKGWTRLLPQK